LETDLPIQQFDNQPTFEAWLENYKSLNAGIWIRFANKNATFKTVSYAEAVETALCFGWIDGQVKKYDEQSRIQRFTPRRKRSMWSKINREKAQLLIEQGLMRPEGLKAINEAKKNGNWDKAYDSPSNITIHPNFEAVLQAHPEAYNFFEHLNKTNRYAMMHQVNTAKSETTRARRIEKYLNLLLAKKKLY
jgi:uncharacterized protein YdeI (YjbR/CyaY-like superfamily)